MSKNVLGMMYGHAINNTPARVVGADWAGDGLCQPDGNQSDVTYTCRLVRATALPGLLGMLRTPVLRSLASLEWARASRAGLLRLIGSGPRTRA